MTHFRTARFWLLTGATLLAAGQVQAQSKQTPPYGAPTMVQAAPGFPSIPAEQIARDVTEEINPRTGQREFVAAPFDPFERDPTVAASVRLRSVDETVAIDGRRLRDGALLEMDVYYNSPSDDPYAGRGYGDALFLNGEPAPVVTRDSRILECSTRVENVVYDHTAYYGGPRIGIYRPYRHYSGHYGFADQGFGYGYGSSRFRDRGYGYGNRGYRSRDRQRDVRRDNRQLRRELRERDTRAAARVERERVERARREEGRRNLRRVESYDGRRGTRGGPQRAVNPRPQIEMAQPSGTTRSAPRRVTRPTRTRPTTTRPTVTRPTGTRPTRAATPRVEPATPRREARPARRVEQAAPRAQRAIRAESAPRSRPTRVAPPKKAAPRAVPRRQRDTSSSVRRRLDFFPADNFGGREVVTSRSVDCAREETLRVFLPSERLDAARFDGLTVLVLDREGRETPVFIPPNYIEGFRLAASGQIRPQGVRSPVPNGDIVRVPQPSRQRDSVACPVNTILQPDGTCLQSGVVGPAVPGYPRP